MQPRLLIGDYLLVSKWPYGYSRHSLPLSLPLIPGRILASTPERGDVVVFKAPPSQRRLGFPTAGGRASPASPAPGHAAAVAPDRQGARSVQ